MTVTPEQQRNIDIACRKYQREMQKLVNRRGSGIDSISMTACGRTVTIAEKKVK